MARRVLIKVGGETIAGREDRRRFCEDLAAVRRTGAAVAVVHGGGPQATELGQRLGIESVFRGGRRVTDEATLEVVEMALVGRVGTELLATALGCGLPAVALTAGSGRLVRGVRRPPRRVGGESEPVDFGLVADVEAVDGRLLETLWSGGFVPLLSPLVVDMAGDALNLNADTLCSELASALAFDDVVYVTGVAGVYGQLGDPSSHLAEVGRDEIAGLIERGAVRGGMIAKLEDIGALLDTGVPTVWIVGFDEELPVASALSGAPGLRTAIRRR